MVPGRMRRVAIAAFVGEGARAFIRKPKGVEVVCWPKAGGTNPLELRRLKKAGARIRFADRLHMKVYWAAKRGAIITSANMSKNALGAGDLKEFGVLVPPDSFSIDEVIASLKSRPFNSGDMQKLEREHRKLNARQPPRTEKVEKVSFCEWFELPARPEWKFGWWDEFGPVSRKAKEIGNTEFNVRQPHNFVSCRATDYREADWILSFRLAKSGASSAQWIYVDFKVKVSRNDRKAYYADYPFQAVQVFPPSHYPPPPFAITKGFRTALRDATIALGIDRLKRLRSVRVPRDLLGMIRRRLRKNEP